MLIPARLVGKYLILINILGRYQDTNSSRYSSANIIILALAIFKNKLLDIAALALVLSLYKSTPKSVVTKYLLGKGEGFLIEHCLVLYPLLNISSKVIKEQVVASGIIIGPGINILE